MGALKWTATREPRGPAAAVILDDEQVTAVGEGEGAGVEAGDRVDAEVELDSAPREVEVPDALASVLAGDASAAKRWESPSHTHRKEYPRWVQEAKRQETRDRRVVRAVEMLCDGETLS